MTYTVQRMSCNIYSVCIDADDWCNDDDEEEQVQSY